MAKLLLPRRLIQVVRRPLRVVLDGGVATAPRTVLADDALRLGYGAGCEVRLDGESGPEIVCSLERPRGPLRLWTPLAQGGDVDVLVDGVPLSRGATDVRPGSRVEVFDRRSGRRYGLVVSPRGARVPRRALVAIIAFLMLAGLLYGVWVQHTVRGTRSDLARTEGRLRDAESDVADTRVALERIGERVTSTEGELGVTVRELRRAQAVSERAVRTEFDLRLAALGERARTELARLSERDSAARSALERDTRAEMAALHRELEARMVTAYRDFKRMEQRLAEALDARIEAVEPSGARFKQILSRSRGAVLFIRTTFDVEDARSGERVAQLGFGTGFLVASAGLALTAQHVLFPWHYDRRLQVLLELDLVRVLPDSVRWTIWPTDEPVVAAGEGLGGELATGPNVWRSGAERRAVHHLYSPPIDRQDELVEAPVGMVAVRMPRPGPSDVAVLGLSHAQPVPGVLSISDALVEPLDETLAIGYPLSRLEDGRAAPQAVTGFVRRIVGDALELNTPLNPGVSGGPVLSRRGDVIGMAVGIIGSDVYGIATRARDLAAALEQSVAVLQAEEARLAALGCDPGLVDGRFDDRTHAALRCAAASRAP